MNWQRIGRVGFGCYRIREASEEHAAAIDAALRAGCNLFDTASNYSDGSSELLLGRALAHAPDVRVITKVGYISPSAYAWLAGEGIDVAGVQRLSPEAHYSLKPDVLMAQLKLSLARLRRRRIDVLLLHNPEHILPCASSVGQFRDEIKAAFACLENATAVGLVGEYGVSSNVLSEPNHPLSVELLADIADEIAGAHHFRVVQFPLNWLESDAATVTDTRRSLVARARGLGLVTIANRPLHAMKDGRLVRLASYEREWRDQGMPSHGQEVLQHAIHLVRQRLQFEGVEEDVMDVPVMKFLRDSAWNVDQPELVDSIWDKHFEPLITHIWRNDVPSEERKVFADLRALMGLCAKRSVSLPNQDVGAAHAQRLGSTPGQDCASAAVRFCLESGVDHVLVGMRKPSYVASIQSLFGYQDTPRFASLEHAHT